MGKHSAIYDVRNKFINKIHVDLRNEKIRTILAQIIVARLMNEVDDVIFLVGKELFDRLKESEKKRFKINRAEYAFIVDTRTISILDPSEQIFLDTSIKIS